MFRKMLVLMLLGVLVAGVGAGAFAGRAPNGFDFAAVFSGSEKDGHDHEDGDD